MTFLPASSDKRFARSMSDLAEHDPDRELSERQRHYMLILAWKFRRQMPAHLVPERKPPDLPPKPTRPRRVKAAKPIGAVDESTLTLRGPLYDIDLCGLEG